MPQLVASMQCVTMLWSVLLLHLLRHN